MNRDIFERRPLILLIAILLLFFWKLVFSDQFTFLDSPDLAYQVLPWLQVQARAWHEGVFAMWDPYQWAGQSLRGVSAELAAVSRASRGRPHPTEIHPLAVRVHARARGHLHVCLGARTRTYPLRRAIGGCSLQLRRPRRIRQLAADAQRRDLAAPCLSVVP
jgi:hypothetical protein